MLSIATVFMLFVVGVACLVRDGRVNAGRCSGAKEVDLERMFELPCRVPRIF